MSWMASHKILRFVFDYLIQILQYTHFGSDLIWICMFMKLYSDNNTIKFLSKCFLEACITVYLSAANYSPLFNLCSYFLWLQKLMLKKIKLTLYSEDHLGQIRSKQLFPLLSKLPIIITQNVDIFDNLLNVFLLVMHVYYQEAKKKKTMKWELVEFDHQNQPLQDELNYSHWLPEFDLHSLQLLKVHFPLFQTILV